MPGVDTKVKVRTGPASDALAPSASFFLVGLTERGPTNIAVRITSYAEFVAIFGDRVTYGFAHDQIRAFFAESGGRGRVFFKRIVGAAATLGTKTLNDGAGTPQPTVRIDAKGQGAWSTGVTIAVAAGTVTGTFKITIAYGSSTEVYDNLSTPAEAVTAINNRSQWVTATNLGSASVAPTNNPAVAAASAMSAGNDDRAALVAADYVTAVNAYFGPELGAGVVALPGFTSANVGAGLIAHCDANDRICYLATSAGQTVAQAISAAQSLRGSTGSEKAGLFYPHILIDDGAQGTRTVSPEGFVAGKRALAHEIVGPWQTPAGEIAGVSSDFVKGVERVLTRAEGDQLDAAEVSAIRVISNVVQPYGYRSLSADEINWKQLTYADLVNHIQVEGEKRVEWAVFQPISPALFGDVEAALNGLLEPISRAGGFWKKVDEQGNAIDSGYSIDTGNSVNTSVTIEAGEIRADVAVRPSPVGTLVVITVIKATLTASV